MRELTVSRYTTWHRRVTALLVVLQTVVGTAVAYAHAMEPNAGPVTLESRHTAQCGVLHDTARCTQCQFDATRMLSPIIRRTPPLNFASRRLAPRTTTAYSPAPVRRRPAHPRAPPAPLS